MKKSALQTVSFGFFLTLVISLSSEAHELQENTSLNTENNIVSPAKSFVREGPYIVDQILHDYSMYLERGIKKDTVKGFLDTKNHFFPIKDVMIWQGHPYNNIPDTMAFSRFFGVRQQVLKSKIHEKFVVSMTHPEPNCLDSRCLLGLFSLPSSASETPIKLDHSHLVDDWSHFYDYDQYNSAFGHTKAQLDNHGLEEFFLLNKIYISSIDSWIDYPGIQGAFLPKNKIGELVSYDDRTNELVISKFTGLSFRPTIRKNLKNYAPQIPLIYDADSIRPTHKSRFALNPIFFGQNIFIIVTYTDRLLVFNVENRSINYVRTIKFNSQQSMLNKIHLRIGGVGDYNSDGIADIWIVFRNLGDKGAAWLIDGSEIFKEGSASFLNEISLLELQNVIEYSKSGKDQPDGIGSSISRIAGDLDSDGLPDFSIASHFNLSMTGSLFVLFGNTIRDAIFSKQTVITTADSSVLKIRSFLGSELAPPFFHEDSYDIDSDGFDDIVISADNDGYAGPNAGSIYLLSGKKITELKDQR